jgi:propionyl-CoA carboxylase alpha chain
MAVTSKPQRVITRLLIANRGEIARRIMRTAHAMGIECVVVHSTADAGEPFVAEADLAVHLPGVSSSQTYLDSGAVVAAAIAARADAIHPGYGFLSENPEFAEQVIAAGLIWVGPSPRSIRAMALKVPAKEVAAGAGVPLVPGAELPESMTDAQASSACAQVGFPVLLKASAGGGGRGMRIVTSSDQVGEALESARREALSSFGDGTVFCERYVADARHVEVQVFGDEYGNVVHIFERECSIQRRHQKVIEEAPSPGITESTRAGLHRAATSLARAIGYVGAGTVEFLVSGTDEVQEFFFLEMNTRLQVEHPVTEAITGLDLVAWQLLVAQGCSLPLAQENITCMGHAIEARLYAEDPARGFLPAPGEYLRFDSDAATLGVPGIRIDSGIESGSIITTSYDPMLAKVIAHADNRATAARRLVLALGRMHIHGPTSNRELLRAVLREPAFLAAETRTSFFEEHPEVCNPSVDQAALNRHVVAATLGYRAINAMSDGVPTGWRNVPAVAEHRSFRRRGGNGVTTVVYEEGRTGLSVGLLHTAGDPGAARFTEPADELPEVTSRICEAQSSDEGWRVVVDMAIAGVGARHEVAAYRDRFGGIEEVFVDDGLLSSTWQFLPRFADDQAGVGGTNPVTPVPGTVTSVLVAPGDRVEAGQTLIVIEAMKMEHRIRAQLEGQVLKVRVSVGDSVDAHAVVVDMMDAAEQP